MSNIGMTMDRKTNVPDKSARKSIKTINRMAVEAVRDSIKKNEQPEERKSFFLDDEEP